MEQQMLSLVERKILMNQYEILNMLNPDNSEYETICTALRYNYSSYYSSIFDGMDDDFSPEAQKEVNDIFLMLRRIWASVRELSKINTNNYYMKSIKFIGFDANYETDYYAFAIFLMKNLGSFSELIESETNSLNSHFTTLPDYRIMRNRFDALNLKPLELLDESQLDDIINVAPLGTLYDKG